MKRISIVLFLLFSTRILAWSPSGHILIAKIAYNHFNPATKIQIDKYSEQLYSELPQALKNQANRKYKSASHFAVLAALPDTWRDISLHDIFKQFNATLPKVLKPYADKSTNSWHYIDMPLGKTNCVLTTDETVVKAINVLQQAWHQSQDQNAKALSMVFLAHLIGDIHQPLHNFSRYDKTCENDQGGNDFLIYAGRHPMSLHSLWDKGVGYLFRPLNYRTKPSHLQHQWPAALFDKELKDKNFSSWVQSNLRFAPFVYSIKPDQRIPAGYYRAGQKISQRQITLAGYRLAEILQR